MKRILLTSAGLKTEEIATALVDMSGKKKEDIKIGFVSTASYPEKGNKVWYLTQLDDIRKFGFQWINIVDVSNPNINWRERLDEVHVVVISGGNTFYLLDQTKKSGFDKWIKDNLDNKIFVGISAASIVFTPSIAVANVEPADDNYLNLTDLTGLNIVPFEVSPHTPEVVSEINAKLYSESIKNPIYLMDDTSAIKVQGDDLQIITSGYCERLN